MAYYLAPKEAMNIQMPPDAVQQLCATLRTGGEEITRGYRGGVSRMKEVLNGIKVGEPRFLSVVAEDATACYFAMVQKIENDVGREEAQVVVMANLIARGKLIYYYLSAPYVSNASVTTLLAKHKINVAAVLQANN